MIRSQLAIYTTMNAKNAVPWIFALVFAAGAGLFFTSSNKQEKELSQLRQENAELPNLRTAVEQAKKEAASADAAMTGKEREELIRLRNEVGGLRREKLQLTAQFQQAQKMQENQQAQQAQLVQQNQQLAQLTREQQTDQARNACVNNLRQFDGAKQQWALENKQPADALVVPQQIARYLQNAAIPTCPSGGAYILNNVQTRPTCSVPGHKLDQ